MDLTEEQLQEKINAAVAAATAGLISKRDELLASERALKDKLNDIESKQKADLKKAEQDKLEAEGKLNELIDSLRTSHAEEITKMTAEIEKLSSKAKKLDSNLRVMIVDDELKTKLLEHGVKDPMYIKAATALLKPQVSVVEGEDAYTANIADKPISDFIKTWAEGEGKAFISHDSGGGGSNKTNGGGGIDEYEKFYDPKQTPNLTKQHELSRLDPDRHKALTAKYHGDGSKSLPLNAR